jgi:hypothetical protein
MCGYGTPIINEESVYLFHTYSGVDDANFVCIWSTLSKQQKNREIFSGKLRLTV